MPLPDARTTNYVVEVNDRIRLDDRQEVKCSRSGAADLALVLGIEDLMVEVLAELAGS